MFFSKHFPALVLVVYDILLVEQSK